MKKDFLNSANVKLFTYFIGLSIVGSILFQFPLFYRSGTPVPFIDGLFTAVSALCVTGLSTVDMSVYTPAGFALILVFIEAGGLGIVSFFVLYIAFTSKKMSLVSRKIVRDFFIEDVEFNPYKIVIRIVSYTAIIQIAGTLILNYHFMHLSEPHHLFYSIFLSISAFCNAGFAPSSSSLVEYAHDKIICITIAGLIILGGLGFTVLQNITQCIKTRFQDKRKRRLTLHSKIVFLMTFLLITIGTIVIFFVEKNHAFSGMTTQEKILSAFFESVTTRTAGFETVKQASFTSFSRIITCFLMFCGGSPGSIAGGVKTTTIFLAICFAFRNSADKNSITVYNRDISNDLINKSLSIIIRSMIFLFVVVCILCLTEYMNINNNIMNLDSIIFETFSAFGTVGLSQGITSSFSEAGKLILILTMFAGRTGVVAMALTASKESLKHIADYPREDILVG